MNQNDGIEKRPLAIAAIVALITGSIAYAAHGNTPLGEGKLSEVIIGLGFLWLSTGVAHYAATSPGKRQAGESAVAAMVLVMVASIVVVIAGWLIAVVSNS